jgi:hypothetical protein
MDAHPAGFDIALARQYPELRRMAMWQAAASGRREQSKNLIMAPREDALQIS